ncbi:MAG: hypothetical protein FWF16_09820, partial [Microbacteriaceae bacterium]|nr:hypothetical protein [Microbacteriaceae bacterium]
MSARRSKAGQTGLWIAVGVIILFVLAPIYWMIATGFKTTAGVAAQPPQLFPNPISFENYTSAFTSYSFGTYIMN